MKLARIILAASVAAAGLHQHLPYLPAVNPSSTMISVDAKYYGIMQNATHSDTSTAIAKITQQDHMLYLVLQQAVAALTGSADLTIRIMPVILAILLTVSTYMVVSAYSKNHILAAVSAFFTATSFQIIAGIMRASTRTGSP